MATKTDLAYIAGFVDGEGCVGAYKNMRVYVSIRQKHVAVLEWIQKEMGIGSLIFRPCSNSWALEIIRKEEVRSFLIAIAPYLKIKYEQALLALDMLAIMPGKGKVRSLEEKSTLESMAIELAAMKKREHVLA